MRIKSVKGTNDYLPEQVALREHMEQTILSCYRENGFRRIMTPALEDIENLDKSDGGENLNLIFKIMKRGEKLTKAMETGENLSDMGLRYDLTLPLTRYYSANRAKLELPFKCIQMDRVYRAEQPQKGRLREFIQCDIDIIGDSSPACEMELITVTAKALQRLDIGTFTVKINDRKVLNALLSKCGFADEDLASVCISFDKLDKIGTEGVIAELQEKEFAAEAIDSFASLLNKLPLSIDDVAEQIGSDMTDGLRSIIDNAKALSDGGYTIEFDISLVRGQGYYTGTVFEIKSDKFRGSVAGGGRYDNLIGKFVGENVAACGFSIGFERIFGILSDMNRSASLRKKIAYIYESDYADVYPKAEAMRGEYDVSLFRRPKKMKGFLDRLEASGFAGFITENGEGIEFFG
ncbi:MAG: ATP phosphoribosyltransferase regulatory subunit [Clostridia bacterium]|nr:ATP phosphoribosyltransferase regulatory subunit [Clostridia bacterium]